MRHEPIAHRLAPLAVLGAQKLRQDDNAIVALVEKAKDGVSLLLGDARDQRLEDGVHLGPIKSSAAVSIHRHERIDDLSLLNQVKELVHHLLWRSRVHFPLARLHSFHRRNREVAATEHRRRSLGCADRRIGSLTELLGGAGCGDVELRGHREGAVARVQENEPHFSWIYRENLGEPGAVLGPVELTHVATEDHIERRLHRPRLEARLHSRLHCRDSRLLHALGRPGRRLARRLGRAPELDRDIGRMHCLVVQLDPELDLLVGLGFARTRGTVAQRDGRSEGDRVFVLRRSELFLDGLELLELHLRQGVSSGGSGLEVRNALVSLGHARLGQDRLVGRRRAGAAVRHSWRSHALDAPLRTAPLHSARLRTARLSMARLHDRRLRARDEHQIEGCTGTLRASDDGCQRLGHPRRLVLARRLDSACDR